MASEDKDGGTGEGSSAALLSIVIPAYNVEGYVGKCLDSLLPQCRAGETSVVIVVDGATDGTVAAIDQAIARHPLADVRVIHQPNAGLSAARNTGLAAVRTEYVSFLDSDDLVASDYVSAILSCIRDHEPDLIEFNALRVDESGEPIDEMKFSAAPSGRCAPVSLEDFLSVFRCYAWARVARTEIASRHPFPAGRRFEDAATIPWYYHDSTTIMGLGKALVHYRQRIGSILSSPRASDVADLAEAATRASRCYRVDHEHYWRVVATRIHQVACGRIPLLPLREWGDCLGRLRAAIDGVPPFGGLRRWMQVRATTLYVSLLLVKRLLRRGTPASEPGLLGRRAGGAR